ncbi:MAG: hypothetical protein QM809_08755 [Gordonia sp. (in: high G+C Gram-positive bacteria)]|uniref:hypothetical protein n=1 Tax=Gordonia sp. (in: high G+C Gram-positive bacteria) TaxID=84139 RepID=UPI0039E6E327
MQPLDQFVMVTGDLVSSAATDEVRVLLEVLRHCAQAEASTGGDELLLNRDASAQQIHRSVVVDPMVFRLLAEDLFPGVADAYFSDFGDESVHAFAATTIGGDHFEIDRAYRVGDAFQ